MRQFCEIGTPAQAQSQMQHCNEHKVGRAASTCLCQRHQQTLPHQAQGPGCADSGSAGKRRVVKQHDAERRRWQRRAVAAFGPQGAASLRRLVSSRVNSLRLHNRSVDMITCQIISQTASVGAP